MKASSAALAALLVTTLAHSAPQYTLTLLAVDHERDDTELNAINANGDIAGTYTFNVGGGGPSAFYWQHSTGARVSLPPFEIAPGIGYDGASAINDYGKIVGFAISPQTEEPVPAAWYTSGGMEEIGPYSNGTALTAAAVANTGQAVGTGLINDVGGAQRAVLYRWSTHSMTNLTQLGGNSSGATAISGRGSFITGWSSIGSGDVHAFIWQTWPMKDLGTLGGKTSQGTSVNESGEVVGYSTTASAVQHAFVYRQGKLIDLGNLAPRPD